MQENHNLLAILGPTNTGKTYSAFESMISYNSGIFGFPLRLLARENYDKAVKRLGLDKVALITGEEKIVPKEAKYFFCTVESMPLNLDVECVVIDEVQLAADYERGHVFTDRILNLRGTFETIMLGSTIIENILLYLFPKIKIQKKNRFSRLSFLNKKSLSRLEPRSAIIAFNINKVYEIAESLRTHKGGAAVVLGSLSPRTRNAQVQVYEEKKVDYLVATDAIGMGLNLNINHVSFSSLQKYDGRFNRDLSASELGQIAGRAGRYFDNGTFGYLKNAGTLDPYIIKSIEENKFDSVQKIYWRNSNLDFSSVDSVIASFMKFPIKSIFILKKNAEDEINFRKLSSDSDILFYLNDYKTISLLWEVCRIPDFQKIFNDSYFELLKNIFLTLVKNDEKLSKNWLEDKILRLENYLGGIEELSIKIANIRTWTYIANQFSWIENPHFWQEKTHEIENILSDHLHTSLTNRFVDFRASYFVDAKNKGEKPLIQVDKKKSIKLNGQIYGYINGFDLKLNIPKSESVFSLNHVKKSIRSMIEEKVTNFLNAPKDSLNLGEVSKINTKDDIKIYWGDEPIGKLIKGKNIFSPKAESYNTEFIESDKKILVTKKLQEWINNKIEITLKPISEPIDENINSIARAIIFNIYNSLGSKLIDGDFNEIKKLNEIEKTSISKLGIRIGAKFFFMPNLLKKSSIELNALLWKVYNHYREDNNFPLPSDGRVSFTSSIKMPDSYWFSIGYKCLYDFAIRIDVFERVFYIARKKIKFGPFLESSDMMNPFGCNSDQLENILRFCGFENIKIGDNKKLFYIKVKKLKDREKIIKKDREKIRKNKKKQVINLKNNQKRKDLSLKNISNYKNKENKADPNSPFAVLEKLL